MEGLSEEKNEERKEEGKSTGKIVRRRRIRGEDMVSARI